jgi:hypothetical protein
MANMKWLNVVLNLNGLVFQEKRLISRGIAYVVDFMPYSGNVPILIGQKAVYVCPSY